MNHFSLRSVFAPTTAPLLVTSLIATSLLSGCGKTQRSPERAPASVTGYAQTSESLAQGGPAHQPGVKVSSKKEDSADSWEAELAEEDGMAEPQVAPEFNTEGYDSITENGFVSVAHAPLSTFSVDVDTASYSNMRRFIQQGTLPPAGAVRIEELVNYFDYGYQSPTDDRPFSVHTELSTAPWAGEHQLLHIGIQGRKMKTAALPPRNLVFLLDVSGSMNDPKKLPLLKRSLSALLGTMGESDTVSIVVYAGASGVVLPPTSAHQKARIERAMNELEAGGSTNGGEGIELAYKLAAQNFQARGVNRVILATDGDFNVGATNQSELVKLIEQKRKTGVFLTVLGFGMGNYQDSTLEKLADHGNGNYAYIDTFAEARKVLVEEGGANMVTIAKDVKIQVEMNPQVVGAYRLIGYENRLLAAEDFNDDKKDAGEIGAGHTVTALYEILSPAQAAQEINVDPLKYKKANSGWKTSTGDWATSAPSARAQVPAQAELATIKLRYKSPKGTRSAKVEFPVSQVTRTPGQTSNAFRFSAAVAGFGMLLRDSQYKGSGNFRMIHSLAAGAINDDEYGHQREFLGLVERAARL